MNTTVLFAVSYLRFALSLFAYKSNRLFFSFIPLSLSLSCILRRPTFSLLFCHTFLSLDRSVGRSDGRSLSLARLQSVKVVESPSPFKCEQQYKSLTQSMTRCRLNLLTWLSRLDFSTVSTTTTRRSNVSLALFIVHKALTSTDPISFWSMLCLRCDSHSILLCFLHSGTDISLVLRRTSREIARKTRQPASDKHCSSLGHLNKCSVLVHTDVCVFV